MEDRRSEPSKEWNASILGLRNLGVHGEYHQYRYLQEGTRERQGGTKGTKGERAEDRVRMYEGWGNNTQSVTKFGL